MGIRNFGLLIAGVSLGLVFFFSLILTLNYFNFLSFDFLPHQTKVKKTNLSIQQERAKLAGYDVIWEGNPNDFTGRTILASKAHSNSDWVDKFGWTNASFASKSTDVYQGIGTFVRWEKINGSNDFYALLLNPQDKQEFKVRILVDKSPLSSAVGSKDLNGGNRTRLEIENLDYGPNNLKVKFSERINYFYQIKKETLDKIIKEGDIVTVYAIPTSLKANNNSLSLIRKDQNNLPAIISFIIRRFGGKEEIEKELRK